MKFKKKKWYHNRKIIFGIHLFVFLLFIFFYEIYTFSLSKKETISLASFLQSFVWNLDDGSAKQYLDVYLQNKSIQSIDIQHPDQSTFLKVTSSEQDSFLDIFFIGENYIHRKFGMPKMFQEKLKIHVVELKEHDIFIVGSDGKDDIEIQKDEKGERIINEDETLFLNITEKSEADLKLIIDNIKEMGNLIDDISILILECQKKRIPLVKQYLATDTNSIEALMKNLIQTKNYEEAYDLSQTYVDMYPMSNQILYYHSVCAFKRKKYEEAIEIGERILNRVEEFKNIYPILIQLYSLTGNITRSTHLLEEYKRFTPKASLLRELENFVEKSKDRTQRI
ncbi:MAG: hypothetical protein ACK4UJ_09800 [Leptonema sp. (in: bacteria)]